MYNQQALALARNPITFQQLAEAAKDSMTDEMSQKFHNSMLDFRGKRLISNVNPKITLQWTLENPGEGIGHVGSDEYGYFQILVYPEAQYSTEIEIMPTCIQTDQAPISVKEIP